MQMVIAALGSTSILGTLAGLINTATQSTCGLFFVQRSVELLTRELAQGEGQRGHICRRPLVASKGEAKELRPGGRHLKLGQLEKL